MVGKKTLADEEIHIRQELFLRFFSQSGIIMVACEQAGVHRGAHAQWMQDDESYPPRFFKAQRDACDYLEASLMQLGVQGQERLKFDKEGKALVDPRKPGPNNYYVEHERSPAALMFLLKSRDPARFRENPQGVMIQIGATDLDFGPPAPRVVVNQAVAPALTNGHASNGHASNGHSASGHGSNGKSEA